MKTSGISLRSFARQCGIDSSYLSKVLKGKRNPPGDEKTISKIAEITGMDKDRLMFSCGRIPARLQKIFMRNNIGEILKRAAEATVPVKPSYTARSGRLADKQEIPDEIL